MVRAGANISVILTMIDTADPFEVDANNEPHLSADPQFCVDDALDVLAGDPEFYEDESEGSGEWLMVGPVPGGLLLVVPVSQSRYSGYSKVRPITILRAPPHIEQRYLGDKRGDPL